MRLETRAGQRGIDLLDALFSKHAGGMEWNGGGGSINKQTGNEGIPRTNMRGKKKAASEQVKDAWSLGFCLAAESHQPTYPWSFF